MVVVTKGGAQFYVDGRLSKNLDKLIEGVKKKDRDNFFLVDGSEGSGKSVLALQLAKYVDPTFDLSRVCFTPEEFEHAIRHAENGQAVLFDEAFRGLSSRAALSAVNKLLVTLMMECRQKNLFVFLVLPTFFLLDKYAALFRSKGLFHVYEKNGRRGQWVFFNKQKKKMIYFKGKAYYEYIGAKSSFRGRFLDQYTVDEKAYRQKKRAALEDVGRSETEESKNQKARDRLLFYINKELGVRVTELGRVCARLGIHLRRSAVGHAIRRAEKDLEGLEVSVSGESLTVSGKIIE